MFENILGQPKEQRTQLLLRDDSRFIFRKLNLEHLSLVEKIENIITAGWRHFHATQKYFPGFKNIKADMVTVSHNRDFLYDPFDQIPDKPKNEEETIKYCAEIAESRRYQIAIKPGSTLNVDKITIFLGIGLIILIVIFGISIAWG